MDSPLSATCDATVSCMKMAAGQMPTVHFAAFCLHVVALERIEKMKTENKGTFGVNQRDSREGKAK